MFYFQLDCGVDAISCWIESERNNNKIVKYAYVAVVLRSFLLRLTDAAHPLRSHLFRNAESFFFSEYASVRSDSSTSLHFYFNIVILCSNICYIILYILGNLCSDDSIKNVYDLPSTTSHIANDLWLIVYISTFNGMFFFFSQILFLRLLPPSLLFVSQSLRTKWKYLI